MGLCTNTSCHVINIINKKLGCGGHWSMETTDYYCLFQRAVIDNLTKSNLNGCSNLFFYNHSEYILNNRNIIHINNHSEELLIFFLHKAVSKQKVDNMCLLCLSHFYS
jgi:hypothetical protein